jgi:hypothetical protein
MTDPLLFEHLLEARAAAPGHKLPPVVRENLSRRAPLTDRALGHLQDRVGVLLPEQSPTRDVARVIVDDAH